MIAQRRRRHRLYSATAAVALLFLATALGGATPVGAAPEGEEAQRRLSLRILPLRRRLVGPGSSPPTCRARCGRCTPCRPTRVTVQPAGRLVPMDYYPEAWRCKCGSKLFMP